MKKTALIKDAFRDISKSRGRFISILAIVALGVAFFSGLKIAPKDMKYTADKYFDDYNLMDIRIVSTLGLTDEDLEEISKVKGIKEVSGTYALDALTLFKEKESVIKVLGYTSPDQINGMKLIDGRFPEKPNECLAEAGRENILNIPLHTKIKLYSGKDTGLEEDLENTEYTVVGTVQVPYYLSFEKGNSAIGNGRVGSFIMVPEKNFKLDVFTDIYLTVENAKEINSYTDEYFDVINPVVDELKQMAKVREVLRYEEILDDATEKLEDGKRKYYEGKAEADIKLADALKEIEDAKLKIADGERKLAREEKDFYKSIEEGKEKLAKSELDLVKGEEELEKAINEFYVQKESAEKQFLTAEAEIQKGEEAISTIEGQLYQLSQGLENPLLPEEQRIQLIKDQQTAEAILINTKKSVEEGKLQLSKGKEELKKGEEELNKNIELLKESRLTLESEKQKLINGEKTGIEEFNKAKKDLKKARLELEDGIKEYDKSKLEVEEELKEAWAEIKDAERKIKDIKEGKWYVLDREGHYSYMDYGGAADRINALSKVFPLFFAMVAALVSLTTMTRMVDEQRINIGTLKALGYSRGDISFKFIIYALIATVAGCILGFAVGSTVFPMVIFSAYGIMYVLPPIELIFDYKLAIIISSVSITLTTMTAYMACSNELKENASSLMRPKAPRIGKAVFLERIPFIWNRLNFSYKVTFRNILRYKRRFFMTVFGIAGCTALLLTGFGVRDSIRSVVNRQYGQIFTYDITLGIEEDGAEILNKYEEIKDYTLLRKEGGSISNMNTKKDISIVIPQDPKHLSNFIHLRDPKTKKEVIIPKEGLIITKQVSKNLDIKIGDRIILIDNEGLEATVEVKGITENYISNFVYISKEHYKEIFNKDVEYNEAIGNLIDMTRTAEENLSRDLLLEDGIVSASFNSIMKEEFDDVIGSLGYVVLVIIVSAGSLAFVVLYNLTNVNISERVREIATIKVLGFYDNEVSIYIYRENIILTIIGTLAGLVMGIFLHKYIMTTVEMDNIMFGLDLDPISYLYSIILTIVFSILVNAFMHYKLRSITMVESLKSVD